MVSPPSIVQTIHLARRLSVSMRRPINVRRNASGLSRAMLPGQRMWTSVIVWPISPDATRSLTTVWTSGNSGMVSAFTGAIIRGARLTTIIGKCVSIFVRLASN